MNLFYRAKQCHTTTLMRIVVLVCPRTKMQNTLANNCKLNDQEEEEKEEKEEEEEEEDYGLVI